MQPPGSRDPALVQSWRWGRRPERFLLDNRRRFGPTFACRFAGMNDAVFVSRPEDVGRLLALGPDEMRAGKTKLIRPILGERSLLCLDGDEHLRQRRLLLPPLHGAALARMRATIRDLAEEWERELPSDRPFPMADHAPRLSMAIIVRVVFGARAGEETRALSAALHDLLSCATRPYQLPRMTVLRRDLGAPPRPWTGLGRRLARVHTAVQALVARRRTRPDDDASDVLSLLLDARDEDGSALTDVEVRDELLTMLLAGHETSAATIAWAGERLARHPAAWEALAAEERDGGDGIAYADATVREVLRVRPPLWISGRTLLRPFPLGGGELPAGRVVYACAYLTHTDPDVWDRPWAFAPGRFLDGTVVPANAWFPFGGGRRRCVGAAFARAELLEVLGVLARGRDLRPTTAPAERQARRGMVIAPADGARVELARR